MRGSGSGSALSCAGRGPLVSLVGECQVVQINGICGLFVISVHLVVDRDPPPTGGTAAVTVGPVEGAGHSVESDGLVLELIAGSARYLKGQVVPGIVVGVTGNAGGNPFRVSIVPDGPVVPVSDAALVAPDKAHTVEELINVELQRLGKSEVSAIEVHVIGEVVVVVHFVVILIGHALRGEVPNQVIVKKGITVGRSPANVKLGGFSAHGRGLDVLGHGITDSIARRR